jgi:hypothetical protein
MCFARDACVPEPDEGRYRDDEGEHGLGQPDAWESEEVLDVPEYRCFCLLCFLLTKVSGG